MNNMVRRTTAIAALLTFAIVCNPAAGAESRPVFAWEQLPDLPNTAGVAGPFAGASNGALIVAGGANFPDRMPWEGGKKVYHDAIYVLDRAGSAQWKTGFALPRAIAYGVSITTPAGVVCMGGDDGETAYADVRLLAWRDGSVHFSDLPPLPIPLTSACGAAIGNTIYIAGGSPNPNPLAADALADVWSLDVSTPGATWNKLPPIPGPGRTNAVAAVQEGSFFVVSGIRRVADEAGQFRLEYLKDGYRFSPATRTWKRIADLPRPNAAVPSPAPAIGQSHFVLLGGGARGGHLDLPMQDRPGTAADCLAYHTITDTWTIVGQTPAPRVVAPVVPFNGAFVIPSGESQPGRRSPAVWSAKPVRQKQSFGLVNYLALGSYPLIMLAISYAVGKKRTSEEFFRGGQRIPWWAAGISIFATMLSSITYMAIPAKAYATDWSFFIAGVAVILTVPVVVYVYLPFFRQLDITSAYEYLERRFNLAVRWFGSASFILLQIGRTAIVLYLPSLALATVTNLDIRLCIIAMGIISILMTFMGGIESVVWTDVAQTVILMAGAIVTLAIIVINADGGLGAILTVAARDEKLLQNLDFSLSPAAPTFWVLLLGTAIANLIPYTASQDVVQRYVTTPDEKQAAKAIWVNAVVTVPAGLVFFGLGTALYFFYRTRPDRLDATLANDAIYPLFMVRELPAGVAGLVVAGIFAAAQPTSNLNSMATAVVADFYDRMRPHSADSTRLRLAQGITVFFGVIGTLAALALATFDILSIYDVYLSVAGLTGGVLAGLFALGIFTRRANGTGALTGAILGTVALYAAQKYTKTSFLLYGAVGIGSCFIIGYLASLFVGGPGRPLEGLTIYTRARKATPASPTPNLPPVSNSPA